MPIYEYLCQRCGQVFEKLVLQREVRVECPTCPGASVERLLSAFSFRGGGRFVGSSGCRSCSATSG